MAWLAWALPLALLVFIWSVNEHLRGRWTKIFSGVLALGIFALCGMVFWVSGFWSGLIALAGAFALGAVLPGPARRVAERILRSQDLPGVDWLDQPNTEQIMEGFWDERVDRKREDHRERAIAKAMAESSVQKVMSERGLSSDDLGLFYDRVEIWTLKERAREIALCNAKMLDFFFANYEEQGLSLDAHLVFQLWARTNPGGDKPAGV